MKIKVTKREGKKKSELSQARHEGNIPAVIYGKGITPQNVTVDGADFDAAVREMRKGHLPTTVFEFELDGKAYKVLVKDIQYHRVSYRIQHVDLMELQESMPVNVSVPVEFDGDTDCKGVKLGGLLRQVIRLVPVRCLPKHIPSYFTLNIRDLGINQSLTVGDIAMPEGVRALLGEKNVVVTIGKR